MSPKKKVLLGMSGGVDSSVAAHLLLEAGYEVIGATMRLWVDEDDPDAGGCCSLSNVEDARQVAARFGIPHYVLNYKDRFQQQVVDYFVAEYQAGRTPNPCIACNSRVRFTTFLQQALAIGCDYIATGHYARVWQGPSDRYRLQQGVDINKDQSYMLFRITEAQLKQTLFPLGEMTKPQVRSLADQLGLVVAEKPDSQEICFIPDDDYRRFLLEQRAVSRAPGDILSVHGNVLGRHEGAFNYTIGQRKGLGISAPAPLYVTAVDIARNTVTVGYKEHLFADSATISDLHFMEDPTGRDLTAKVRYSQSMHPCQVTSIAGDRATVQFDPPVRAITPGQSLVLYDRDIVVGGGVIS
jgi:tRNA-uridine 2-sulfurtransferase